MTINDHITSNVLSMATALLGPYVEGLTPKTLVAALQTYSTTAKPQLERPLTRKEVAEMLGVSLQTISNYLRAGRLRKIQLTERSCRIDPVSVRRLMQEGAL